MEVVLRLANAQNDAYVRGDGIPLTLAKPKEFAMLAMFLQTSGQQERLSASDTIKTPFDFEIADAAFGPKRPGAPHRDSDGGEIEFFTSKLTEYEWAKSAKWHEQALQGNSILSPEGSQRFWSIMQKKNKDFILKPLIDMEEELFAQPSTEMFTGNSQGIFPIKSLPTGCNIWEEKHYPSGQGGDGLFPGMTDQQGLSPRDSRFVRKDGFGKTQLSATKVDYGEAGTNNTTVDDHLLDRMDYLVNLLGWEPVPLAGEFADGLEVNPRVAYCSREARAMFLRTNRAHDSLFSVIKPFGDSSQAAAEFGGISFMVSDTIRNAKVYPNLGDRTDGAAGVAGASGRAPVDEFDAAGNPGGVFYFFDASCVNLWFHRERAWEVGPWKSMAPLNEDIMRRLGKSIMQLHFEHFMPNGILHPNKPVTNYGRMA